MKLIVEVITRGECDADSIGNLQALADWINADVIEELEDKGRSICLELESESMRTFLLEAIATYLAASDTEWTLTDDELSGHGMLAALQLTAAIPSGGDPDNWEVGGLSWPVSSGDCDCEVWLSIHCESICEFKVPIDLTGVPVNPQQSPQRIAVQLSFTRTHVYELENQQERFGNVFVLPVTSTTELQFNARFSGEVPHVGSYCWLLGADAAEFAVPPSPKRIDLPHYYPDKDVGLPEPGTGESSKYGAFKRYYGSLSPAEIIECRDSWSRPAEGLPHAHQRAHAHLLHMERGSLLAGPSLHRDCNRVWQVLVNRFWRRAQVYLETGQPLESIEPLPPHRDGVRHWEARVAEEMFDWLRGGGLVGMRELRETFGLFACGRTNAFQSYGAPNGANLLCFPELALLLCDPTHGHDHVGGRAFWFDMAVIWAAMAEMAANCYRSSRYKVCSYNASHNPITNLDPLGFANLPVRTERRYSRKRRNRFFRRWERIAGIDGGEFESLLASGARRRALKHLRRLQRELGRLVLSAIGDEFDAERTGLLPLDYE